VDAQYRVDFAFAFYAFNPQAKIVVE